LRKHESQRSRSEELQGTILPPNSESMKDDNGDNKNNDNIEDHKFQILMSNPVTKKDIPLK